MSIRQAARDRLARGAGARSTVPVPCARNNGTDLPPPIAQGLARLARTSAPRGADRAVWRQVRADAQRIGDGGWATEALALGWSVEELFGVSADGVIEGLAVWLEGRRLVLIDATSAIAAGDGRRRFVFTRPGGAVLRLLWAV